MEFFRTRIAPDAAEKVKEVLDSGWLNEGKYVEEFEEELANFGLTNPVTVNSGTSALHLALVAAEVKEGDEVLLPAQTFIATGTAILMAGAKPVFCDINPFTGNICPLDISRKITEKTKAIIPVHWGGLPCDMEEITKIATDHNLCIVEDAAHAFGSKEIGKIYKLNHFVCFSFQSIKPLTTGDGGAICSYLDKKLKRLRWFSFDRSSNKTHFGDRYRDVKELGYKYHMNNIAAAIGLANIKLVNEQTKARCQISTQYRNNFEKIAGIKLLKYNPCCNYWLFTMLVENRLDFTYLLKANRIPYSVVDRRIDENPIFGGRTQNLTGQEIFDEKQISIPVHEGLTYEDVEHIIETIQKGW